MLTKKQTLIAIISLSLVLCFAVGGSLAWIMDSTDPVVNTFTYGDINIELTETVTDLDNDDDDRTNAYKMIPGNTITKDPTVTVKANSEACWLFVKIEKSSNFGTFMTYGIADGWTQGDGTNIPDNVYYREVAATTADTDFPVLANNQVTVLDTVTKEMLNALDAEGATNYPKLTFTAYAVQQDNVDNAEDAWNIIANSSSST